MKHFRNILYVASGPGGQEASIARAVSLADNNQADLTVMDVVPPVGAGIGAMPGDATSSRLQASLVSKRRDELASLLAPYAVRGGIRISVQAGQAYLEVIRAVLRDGHDLLVKPAENPDFIARMFGGNDMHLLRKCPCPVWLTRPGETANYARILAAVDVEPDFPADAQDRGPNRQVLELAASLATSDFAELHVVHAWDTPAERAIRSWSADPEEAVRTYVNGEQARHEAAFNRLRVQLQEAIGKEAYDHLAPRFHLRRGSPARLIPAMALQLQADLVVMGTLARSGIAGVFIGNTAELILEQLQCSVLAVKPRGFVSPIRQEG